MSTEKFYAVDINPTCKGQRFKVTRIPGSETICMDGKPITLVEGMGIFCSSLDVNLDVDASGESFIYALLARVDVIPLNVRESGV